MCRFYSRLLTCTMLAVFALNSQLDPCSAAGLRGVETNRAPKARNGYHSAMNNVSRITLQKIHSNDSTNYASSSTRRHSALDGTQWKTSSESLNTKLSVGDVSNVYVDERQQGDTVVGEAVVGAFY
mmetsp:Transcript_3122/g.5800  ORF Transcript_3122/g.5800 Transcript_3122/m.5800 type:complete len:126 (+) Transcript_3122:181-558(+)